ncbi:MAG: nucleotidyltransferase domain-containing protein [Lachnospiraceae bacterium]|nr:nucleotidyltransferase domain-containing protein [Lachnospiraceae bacterium]
MYKKYLYGSYARGDYTSESDIDIMIVLRCEKDKVKSYKKQGNRVASKIGSENDVEASFLL